MALKLDARVFCLFLLCLAVLPCRLNAQVPTPASVLGHTPGDDFYLADYEDTVRYFHALADASAGRMKMFTVGKTSEGKDIEIAVISSADNLTKLDETKKIAGRMAHAADLTDETARELAR